MALNWLWDEYCGDIIVEQQRVGGETVEFPLRLYKGNAYLIMVYEDDENDTYTVSSFFLDKEHAKRCLGLDKKDKDSYNIHDTGMSKWKKVRLNKAKYKKASELVSMLVQAFDEIEIEIYSDKEEKRREG